MKDLTANFSFLKPKMLNQGGAVNAWFSLKNSQFSSQNHAIPGLNLGFNTSEQNEIIVENRLAMLNSLNIHDRPIAYADQVHGDSIQLVGQGGTYSSTDGLITKKMGLTLGIQVADCAAVLCWDAESNIIGAFHAGWRGAAAKIIPKGIERMIEEGTNPATMKVYVSPCISQKKFEIGQEVAVQFPEKFVNFQSYDKPHLDLKGVLKNQILSTGIHESHIEISDECTIEDAERFYSFRREGKKSGRMMALIQVSELNS